MQSSSAIDDVNPSLLVIVVDADFDSWKSREASCFETQLKYHEMVASLVIFCNAYVLMHRQNRLCILASSPSGCIQIYPRRSLVNYGQEGNTPPGEDDFVPLGHVLSTIITEGLLRPSIVENISALISPAMEKGVSSSSSLSRAFSKALCIIHRQLQLFPKLQPRVLAVQVSHDHPGSYNSMMNSIFSADHVKCPFDACVLTNHHDSHFLQQACYITGGIYIRPLDQRDLLQVMLTHYLPSSHSRQMLQGHVQRVVDFRATCVCHRTPVEFAYMCSVCLALFCQAPVGACLVCGTTNIVAGPAPSDSEVDKSA
jgi:transcription initiation factor TFIIH subunit 3